MSPTIREVPAGEAPMELLLLADPSEEKVRSYLPESRCFVAARDGVVVGACVVQPRGAGAHEIMSIAVDPGCQKSGYGTALLKWVVDHYRGSGARQLEVGTGTFGYQLAFYQRLGFRVTSIDPDFFVENYPEPIFENGIQLFDMLRLTLRYSPDPEADDLVVVGRFLEPFDAHVVAGALEAAGLVATIRQEQVAGLNAPLSVASGGALVLVPRRDAAQARLVLEGSSGRR